MIENYHQVQPVSIFFLSGSCGCNRTDDSRNHAGHAVQIVNAASVVNAEFAVNDWLHFSNIVRRVKNVSLKSIS